MLNGPVKKIVALVATAAILLVAYYGSYLPLRKSQAYIAILRNMNNVHKIDDFTSAFNSVFAIPSPIGQEELVRNMASTVVSLIATPSSPQAIVEPLVQFVEDSFRPIMDSNQGMSFSQNLYILGNIHQAAFLRTNDPRHLAAARQYYEWGTKRGPNRPQFLYGLLDVYRLQGDTQGVIDVGSKILSLWPTDERVKAAIGQFLEAQRASSTKAATPKKGATR